MYHLGSFCSEHTFGIVAALCSVSVCLHCMCDCAFGLLAYYDPVPPLLLYMFCKEAYRLCANSEALNSVARKVRHTWRL